MTVYKFRDCYLNLSERRVLKNGQYLDLTPRAFDILQFLLDRRGEIVTKDDILDNVWNGSFVEEGNLAVHISKLRRQLEESKNQPFIETVQGSGYRFVAPVQETNLEDWEKIISGIDQSATQKKRSSEWAFDSIAVMPLENESNDPEIEYLADGLTENFINSLSRLPDLKVIARNTVFRYKNKSIDPREIGKTLGTATTLTGRIRLIKDRLIIGIELTRTDTGAQLWGTHFNRVFTDIFEIQESVISEVLEKLKSEINYISKKNVVNSITNNLESYKFYLRGKYLLDKRTKETIYKAIESFQKSIIYDPTNIYAYAEVIESYVLLYAIGGMEYHEYLSKIKSYLVAMKQLDESLDIVQTVYSRVKYYDWKFEESEEHIKIALQLNPNNLTALYRYSVILIATGRFSEAIKELNKVIQIDPLSFRSYLSIGREFYKMEKYESALIYLNDALYLEPENFEALAVTGSILTEIGRYDEALEAFHKSLEANYYIEVVSMIGYVYALQRNNDGAYKIIDQMKSEFSDNFELCISLARIYVALGANKIALKLLQESFVKHEPDIIAIFSDPRLSRLRNEPEAKNLVKKMGLPIYAY